MRHLNYTLTPSRINNVRAKARPYRLTDGGGLYVQVMPSGIKTWRYRYTLGGATGDVRIGHYPEIGVADARDRHFELRQLVERGQDPAVKLAQEREELEARAQPKRSADDLEAFSKRWVAERLGTRTQGYRAQILSRLERFVWPAIGQMSLGEVKPRHVLEILEARRSTPNTAEGVRVIIQQLFNYAIQKLIVEANPALPLRGVIDVPRAQHHRHLNEEELGAFWNSVARQGAHFVTIAATQFLLYTMCRKSEVLRARWTEFDFAKAQWDIPASRMKSRRPHRVYLSKQAIELLTLLQAKTGRGDYVFPSTQRAAVPLVDCTLNHFFKRLDFGVEEFSPHGTRGTAATLLREHGFGRDVVELLLAHTEKSQTAAAYHHHELEPERRRALQYLADQIDRIAKVDAQQRAVVGGPAVAVASPGRALAMAEAE
jgi:integrase